MLLDTFSRSHTYLRISLTDNCNLRCFYCMPEEDYQFTPHRHLMQPDEIEALAQIFVAQGVNKIRLTGGEPLLRKDAAAIIRRLSALPVDLTLTTNGILIDRFIDLMEEVGIRSVNISLDTLQRDTFRQITRRDEFDRVWQHIQLLLERQFRVKINVVVVEGINNHEMLDFVALTQNLPVEVRFIEFMPFDGNRWSSNQVITAHQMLSAISQEFDLEALPGTPHDTAKTWRARGHAGTVAVISTMSDHFCGGCNRLRLTADGKLKNCLFSRHETDLLTPLRAGEPVLPLIRQTVAAKARALGGQFSNETPVLPDALENRSMIRIGG